jgi:two-component system, OmpR family, sensor histidine kinase CpxA
MRSLAFKIFGAFWTIHAVIFVVLAFLPDPNGTAHLRDITRTEGRLAAAILEETDAGTCAKFVAGVGRAHAADVTLYNSSFLPVCRSSAGIDDRTYRAAVAGATPDGVVTEVGGREVSAVTFSVRGGQEYRFALAATSDRHLDPSPPRFPVAALLTVVFVSGTVCLILAWYLAAPLRRMREATHRLREGDLSARAGFASRNDEIGDVVRDFDLMADRIESLVQGQKQLLSGISHELRSPLARLGVAVELARRNASPAADAHLQRIEAEAARMNELIGTLLDLSREDFAQSRPDFADFDLAAVVGGVVADAQYEAGRTGRRVELSGEKAATAHGNPKIAATAIDNVVRNALRYTPQGSSVDVALSESGGFAVVSVRDHGPGVPPAELERIFEPFYRLDSSRNRESGGFGLGLSIARRSAAIMGGTVTASNAEGGGLQLVISLPRAPRA